jgi:glycosyltransferase involved in cell wall biosynthesis
MFSVVCPTYNSSQYIGGTLDSILAQKFLPSEVIISDDGSTDDTISIIQHWIKNFNNNILNIRIISNRHRGPGATRNKGILNANEEWIAFLDADDTWHPQKLLTVYEKIKRNNDCNTVLHWENFIRLDGTKSILKHGINYKLNEKLPNQLYKSNFFSTSALVFKRKLIVNANGFDTTLPNWQDYEFWLRLSPDIKLIIIPNVLGSYYETLSSITLRPYQKKIRSNLRVILRYRKYASKKTLILKLIKIIFSKSWLNSFTFYSRNKITK